MRIVEALNIDTHFQLFTVFHVIIIHNSDNATGIQNESTSATL